MTDKKEHIEKRITLDKIDSKPVFKVSEHYFDKLPTRIQDRVIQYDQKRSPGYILSISLKLALPVIALIIMTVYLGLRFNQADITIEAMIDEVSTEELITYLNDSELSTEELLSLIDINELDIDGMLNENIEFLNEDDLEDLINEYPDYESDI